MPSSETFEYTDGSHATRYATIERGATTELVLVAGTVGGTPLRVPIDMATPDPGGAAVKGVSTALAFIAYALLGWFKQHDASYGARVALELDGRRVVARYEEHPADAGTTYPHPGVTLLEATLAPAAPPATGSDGRKWVAGQWVGVGPKRQWVEGHYEGGTPSDDGVSPIAVVYSLASILGTGLGAYHGYRRHNGSLSWALAWAALGSAFPIITVPVAFAQGFGQAVSEPEKPKPTVPFDPWSRG